MSLECKALSLDALGTLVRLDPPAPRLRAALRERFGLEISEQQAASALAQEIAFYRQHLNEGRDADGLEALRRRCTDVLRAGLPQGAAGGALAADELEDALLSSLHFSAFEDAPATLATLRSRGISLVVVSNWDVSLHDVLERVGLISQLDGIVTSAEVGARKPAPEIFRRGLALVGAAPAEALHVGDSHSEDVLGARNAGIEPILIARAGAQASERVRTIRSLEELLLI